MGTSLKPSEVRGRILGDHADLRRMLAEIEDLAERFERGDAEVARALRDHGLALHARLCAHLDLEDEILAPALQNADAWGEVRAERLAREHREQRELLQYLLERLREESRPTLLVAREFRNFALLLRSDMEQEEETALREDLLRDDARRVDPERG